MQENATNFRNSLLNYIDEFRNVLTTPSGSWSAKGFIDVAKNIYTISPDTKVISKVIELMLIPVLQNFSKKAGFEMIIAPEQNYYPDFTFLTNKNQKISLDIKSAYRTNEDSISGFTLGAFTGYFRSRESGKNILFPYKEYNKHYVLGIIYSKQDISSNKNIYTLNDIEKIISVIRDFDFVLQEKYKIAKDKPGSGNTKNIGSGTNISELKNGQCVFSKYGAKVFDDYWMNYMTPEMARNAELEKPPYQNLDEYLKYRNIKNI
ncbi:MAG: restriction endonuclease [Gammaproteobacteria bacterium]|nr:restriction endonuclease [Gammaproteobacteria bacterium]